MTSIIHRIARNLPALLLLTASTSRAEYYTFSGENDVKVDGSDILYQETRYPFWPESTYNARWFPGIAGEKTRTALYSGPAYGGSGDKGSNQAGYIWSFWGVDQPVHPGDSVVPVWWHPSMHDVPSIGEGASGKVEGKWSMRSGVWYPGVLRIWRPTGDPADTSMAGQWIKDGVSGKWHHMATFRMPFVANRFSGDCGFIEDHSHGNRNPRRVDFRNYYFRKSGKWVPGRVFKPSTRQETEKGTSGLIEDGTAGFFETCSGESYKGNMGPGSQELTHMLKTPDVPVFDPVVVAKAEVAATPKQAVVKWSLDERSSPQFSYRIELFSTADASGVPFKTVTRIDPDANQVLIATEQSARAARISVTDIFDQLSTPVTKTAFSAEPQPAAAVKTTASGLNFRYYEGDWKALPVFDSALDKHMVISGSVNGLDLSIRRKGEGFACIYRGCLNVPVSGIWQFSLRTADGGRLHIDGQPVIESDGIHSAGYEVAAARPLAAGLHEVEVATFKAVDGSPEECQIALAWEGPGVDKQPVPDAAWHRVAEAGEPIVKMVSPTPDQAIAVDKLPEMKAAVKGGSQPLQMVRFYQNSTVGGVAWAASQGNGITTFSTREILGCGRHPLRARLIYGEKSQYSTDSPAIPVDLTKPQIQPWQFSAIGRHAFPAASAVNGDTHTLLGDGLNFNWQKIKGDTTIVAKIKRRPSNSWVSQFDGSTPDGGWTGGIMFRSDLEGNPGSEIGKRFVALFASSNHSIHAQDHTNHNAGGQFWGENLQSHQSAYQWLKLQRQGDVFRAFLSVDGRDWKLAETRVLTKEKLPEEVYAGVFTLARPSNNTNPNRWQFSDVSLGDQPRTAPVKTAFSAHWPMDEGTGAGLADQGAARRTGTLPNGAKWVPGVKGTAVEVNGSNQSIVVPPLEFSSNHLTITGWVRRAGDQTAWSGIAMTRGSACAGLTVGPDNDLRFNWDAGKNASYNHSSGLGLPDGRWVFVALVVEPSQATLYLKDGETLRSSTCKGEFGVTPFDADFHLGWDPNNNERYFRGAFDDFRIIDKALGEAEIQRLSSNQ